MRKILNVILSSGQLSFLNVLKRLGRESGETLSFPKEGWTFAIDFPIREQTEALTHTLDGMVIEAGGRIYLGKDAFVSAANFRTMYPESDRDWRLKRSTIRGTCLRRTLAGVSDLRLRA